MEEERASTALDVAALAAEATAWLRRIGVAAEDGRVAAAVDVRTVRYYASLGLVDRPVAYADRRAWYGRRHLLQVVAVKRLQAGGLSLAEVQGRLAGATDAELVAVIADQPVPAPGPLVADISPSFWRQRPRDVTTARLRAAPSEASPPAAVPPSTIVRQTRLEVAPGIAVVIDLDRWPHATDPTVAVRLARHALTADLSTDPEESR